MTSRPDMRAVPISAARPGLNLGIPPDSRRHYETVGRTGDELRHAIMLDYQEQRREEPRPAANPASTVGA
jgi:hypothetical protein